MFTPIIPSSGGDMVDCFCTRKLHCLLIILSFSYHCIPRGLTCYFVHNNIVHELFMHDHINQSSYPNWLTLSHHPAHLVPGQLSLEASLNALLLTCVGCLLTATELSSVLENITLTLSIYLSPVTRI